MFLNFHNLHSWAVTDLVIVIDERSADDTGGLAKSLSATVMRHTRNKGNGFALKFGLIELLNHNPDIIVTIDADGQHDPSEIPRLVGPILKHPLIKDH
jgi:glycosyltransferase involved in cell wall biosynthesis